MIKFIKSLFTYKTDIEDNNDDVFSRIEMNQNDKNHLYLIDIPIKHTILPVSGEMPKHTILPVSGLLSEWWGHLTRRTGSKE